MGQWVVDERGPYEVPEGSAERSPGEDRPAASAASVDTDRRLGRSHPPGPGLGPGENGATLTSREAKHPPKFNDVSRHLLTVSRDLTG